MGDFSICFSEHLTGHPNKQSNMITAKRYESVWNAFLKELPRNPTITLSSVQNKWHTNRKGMRRRMSNNGLSVKEAKKRIRGCNQYVTENPIPPIPEIADSLFQPMTTDRPALQSEFCDILSGLSLIFPDGTQVNINPNPNDWG